jgi:hypothetical protein
MEMHQLIDSLFSVIFVILGWFARELWVAVKDLKTDLAVLRESLPSSYVSREDYRSDMHDIKAMLSKIFDKIDAKKDK